MALTRLLNWQRCRHFAPLKRKHRTSRFTIDNVHGLYTLPVTSLIVMFLSVAASRTPFGMGFVCTGTSKIKSPVSSWPLKTFALNGLFVIFAPEGYFRVNSLK